MHAIRQICLGGLIVALGSFLSPLALGEWSDFVRSAKDAHKHRELRTVDEVDGKKVEQVERRKLLISWFQPHYILHYSVDENGKVHNYRYHQLAVQANQRSELNIADQQELDALLAALPASKANPPVERTVYVSFLVGKDWRTVSYDSAELPKEFERVMLLIGERFETKKRLKP